MRNYKYLIIGSSAAAVSAVKALRKEFGNIEIVAGNIATAEAAKDLIEADVDGLKAFNKEKKKIKKWVKPYDALLSSEALMR